MCFTVYLFSILKENIVVSEESGVHMKQIDKICKDKGGIGLNMYNCNINIDIIIHLRFHYCTRICQ